MDRVQNYNLQTPLTANDLNRQRDFDAIALGKILSALVGTGTVAEGLDATAVSSTTVPTVQLADGQLWELGTLDPTAFGSLPVSAFPSTQQLMKQGLLLSARGDANQFQLIPPGTSGDSVIYLLEAQYADADEDVQNVTLYNVSDPSAPTQQSLPRQRWGTIAIVLKAGAAASSPVAPSADSGYIPLYNIEVAYGQTVLSQSDITVASGAPFLSQTLAALMTQTGTLTLDNLDVTGTAVVPPATASDQAVILGQLSNANIDSTIGPLSFCYYSGSAQTVPSGGGISALIFPTKITDTLSEYDATTGTFTPAVSGLYLFNVRLVAAFASSTSGNLTLGISSSSTSYSNPLWLGGYWIGSATTVTFNVCSSILVELAGGTPYYFTISQGSTETMSLTPANSSLTIARIIK